MAAIGHKFTFDQLKYYTPSRKMGISYEHELRLRKDSCLFIAALGKACDMGQLAIATASVYFHIFYAKLEFSKRYDRHVMGATALFLAGKVEERGKRISEICQSFFRLLRKPGEREEIENLKKQITEFEVLLMDVIDYQFNVTHPYKYLMADLHNLFGPNYANREDQERMFNEKDGLPQMAWFFVNDSLRSTLCLIHDPHDVAIAVLFLALGLKKIHIEKHPSVKKRQQEASEQKARQAHEAAKAKDPNAVYMPPPQPKDLPWHEELFGKKQQFLEEIVNMIWQVINDEHQLKHKREKLRERRQKLHLKQGEARRGSSNSSNGDGSNNRTSSSSSSTQGGEVSHRTSSSSSITQGDSSSSSSIESSHRTSSSSSSITQESSHRTSSSSSSSITQESSHRTSSSSSSSITQELRNRSCSSSSITQGNVEPSGRKLERQLERQSQASQAARVKPSRRQHSQTSQKEHLRMRAGNDESNGHANHSTGATADIANVKDGNGNGHFENRGGGSLREACKVDFVSLNSNGVQRDDRDFDWARLWSLLEPYRQVRKGDLEGLHEVLRCERDLQRKQFSILQQHGWQDSRFPDAARARSFIENVRLRARTIRDRDLVGAKRKSTSDVQSPPERKLSKKT